MDSQRALLLRIRLLLYFFITALFLSGLTAFPLRQELALVQQIIQGPVRPWLWPPLVQWLEYVNAGLQDAYSRYPFLAYGTDWLAFAHLVIALAFFGVLRDPVRNLWVVEWGMIACALVIPLALVSGALRDIPLLWRLLDSSFGIFGIMPLYLCWRYIHRFAQLSGNQGPWPVAPA